MLSSGRCTWKAGSFRRRGRVASRLHFSLGSFTRMRVTVIGTGYVGTVTGVCLAYLGHEVSCVDLDESKISRLQKGDIPIYEPFLAEMLPLAAQHGTLEFTTNLAKAVGPSD